MELSRVGPFALEERLDPQRRGSVYRAIHLPKHVLVALKLFPAPLETSTENLRAFAEEREILKRLRHPNIARCLGGGIDDRFGYLAYEMVNGETLESLLARRGKLSWESVVEYSQAIGSALEVAHDAGVVHESLEPDKILLSEEGQIRLLDFRFQRSQRTAFQSSTRRTLAKVRYLAPEQIDGHQPITHKVDLYALGCIMFQMLTGTPPFAAGTVEEMLNAHRTEMPQRVATLCLDCPIWLDALICQLLEKDPAQRPHSAASVQLALVETQNRMASGIGVAEHSIRGISAIRMNVDKSDARKLLGRDNEGTDQDNPFYERVWFLATSLGIVLAILVGGIAWSLRPLSEDQLIAKATVLMATGDRDKWDQAKKNYLEPLLEKFPNGRHAAEARQHLDTIDMDLAETRLRIRTRLGREPATEGERLYADAWTFEQFGDRVTALDKYQSMVNLLDDHGTDRPFINLARRQIARLSEEGGAKDRIEFVKGRLQQADEMAARGEALEARKIWHSIVTLYRGNKEMEAFVRQSQARIEPSSSPRISDEPPTSAESQSSVASESK